MLCALACVLRGCAVCCVCCGVSLLLLQGIWVSRPASFNPLISFLNEAIMTFMFLFLVNLMTARWGSCAVYAGQPIIM